MNTTQLLWEVGLIVVATMIGHGLYDFIKLCAKPNYGPQFRSDMLALEWKYEQQSKEAQR